MKGKISVTVVMLSVALMELSAQSQGVIYLSNLGQPSAGGGISIGGGNSLAQPFSTGTNFFGYSLNSVQILMSASATTANSFSLSLYSDNAGVPGISLATFNGSVNPAAAGVYTYISDGITLSPSTAYWLVASAGTSFGDFYSWTVENSTSYDAADNWSMNTTSPFGYIIQNGSFTGNGLAPLQFDVNASPVPEPGVFSLFGLGLAFVFVSRKSCSKLLQEVRQRIARFDC